MLQELSPDMNASTGTDRPVVTSVTAGVVGDVEVIEPELPIYVRGSGDVLRAVGALIAFLLALLVAAVFSDSVSGAGQDVVRLSRTVPPALATALIAAGQLISIVGPVVLVVALIWMRRFRVILELVAAAAAAALAMQGVSSLLSLDVALPGSLGELRGVQYPGPQYIAAATAVVSVVSPWLERTWRRVAYVSLAIVVFTRVASLADSPYDLTVSIVLGWLVGAVAILVFGSPNRRPAGTAVAASLARAGLRPRRLEQTGRGVRGSTLYLVDDDGGARWFVKVFGADQRNADRLVQYYRWVRLRDATQERPFDTLRRAVEHEALVSLAAADGGVETARLRVVAEVEPGGMLLAFEHITGEVLDGVGPDALDDDLLRRLWRVAEALQARQIAHRDLRLAHLIRRPDGDPVLVDFGFGEVAAGVGLLRADVAELLCATAVEVGADRAVQAAVDVLGLPAVADALPRLQPLALSAPTRRAIGEQDGLLGELQDEVQKRAGIEEVDYEELARVRPRTLVGFVVFAIALYALLPRLAEVSDIGAVLASAQWAWVIPMVLAQGLTYVGAAASMEGSVPDRVPYLALMRAQVAAAFADILAPAAIGGMALNTRFLQKKGVDSGVAVAGVGLNAVAGFVAHVLLLGGFLLWAGSGVASATGAEQNLASPTSATAALWIVAGLVVVSGIILAIPPSRRLLHRRVVPLVREAAAGMRELARRPRKLLFLVGGSALITMGFLLALWFAVLAFGGDVSLPALGVAYLLASTVAIVAPTPGGLGALEAALIAALTRLGMSADAAVSAVFLFRTVTFWLPVAPGWVTFHSMQRRGEI